MILSTLSTLLAILPIHSVGVMKTHCENEKSYRFYGIVQSSQNYNKKFSFLAMMCGGAGREINSIP